MRHCVRDLIRGADFAKIQGLEGIYMVNVIEDKVVKEYERMIDKGDTEEEEWDNEDRNEHGYSWTPPAEKEKIPRDSTLK
jgi:hypothetical protein